MSSIITYMMRTVQSEYNTILLAPSCLVVRLEKLSVSSVENIAHVDTVQPAYKSSVEKCDVDES